MMRQFTHAGLVAIVLAGATLPSPCQAQEGSASLGVEAGRRVLSDAYIRVYSEARGSVLIAGWDRDSLSVAGTKEAGAGHFSFSAGEDAAKVGVFEEGGNAGRAELEVHVPRGATVWVKTRGASIRIEDVAGGVDATSVTGRIRISGEPAQVYAESMGGSIEITASAPAVKAKTGGGSITLRGEAEDLSLSTVAGGIVVAGPHLRAGHFESVNGDISFQGELERGASLTFETHSGGIELRLPERASADFAVTSIEGDLESDFPLEGGRPRESMRGEERRFSIGRGDAMVTIRTFSGPIRLLAR